jgi:HD-like signal output (HDOD) protein
VSSAMVGLMQTGNSSGEHGTALVLSPDGSNAREVIRARLEKLNSIPTVPAIVRPLLHYMEKPIDQMEVKRVVDMISCDESIAAQCLRMANSAFYFLPQTVKTIHGAVIVLGVRKVREILLGCSLLNLIPRSQNIVLALALWEHSLGCALLGRELARWIDFPDPERAYLGGLLHDLGEIINLVAFPGESSACLTRAAAEQKALHEVETDSIGFTHCDSGSVVAEMWRLPCHLSEVIRYHHDVQQSKLYPELVALASIADLLCRANELGYGYQEKSLPDPLEAIEWEILATKSRKVARLGPAHLVQELNRHAKRIQKHVKSVFQV